MFFHVLIRGLVVKEVKSINTNLRCRQRKAEENATRIRGSQSLDNQCSEPFTPKAFPSPHTGGMTSSFVKQENMIRRIPSQNDWN